MLVKRSFLKAVLCLLALFIPAASSDAVKLESVEKNHSCPHRYSLRGQHVEMKVRPTLGLYCPFYLSSKGYSLFLEGTWPGEYDFCKTDSNLVKIEFQGPELAMQFDFDNDPVQLVKTNALRVGPSLVPPKWIFRHMRWRDEHKNRSSYP